MKEDRTIPAKDQDYNEFAKDDTLGGRISFARDAANLTTAQAARRLGVETASWKAWECDSSAPRASRLTMMAGFLGVSPAWLLSGIGSGPFASERGCDDETLLEELQFAAMEAASTQKRLQDMIAVLERRGRSNRADPAPPASGRRLALM